MTLNLEEIERARDEADCLADDATVEAALDRMAEAITARLADRNPLVYAVMNGALIFAGRILPRLPFPLELAYLHATRYGNALQGTLLDWRVRPTQDLRGRTVLVLDDILDEGHTLKAVKHWCEDQGAADVRIAVLAEKVHDRCVEGIHADHVGVQVPDAYVFGYGMDYHEQGRNLPAIYALGE